MTARTLAAAALFVALGVALAQPPKATEPVRAPAPPPPPDKVDILKRLASRVEVEKPFDGRFRDAVKMVADKYELPVMLTRAADLGTTDDGGGTRGEQAVRLPRLANVKIETVLALLCEQTETKFLVYPDHIKIVPDSFAVYETAIMPVNLDPNSDETPLLPQADLIRAKPLTKRGLVNATFKNKPLAEVLDEIAEATGANVAVSPLLPANARQAPITVRFANTPVDAAVRTLCEMTETGVIEDANVLLVTTRERAAARAKEEAQKLKDKQAEAPTGIYGGFGGLCAGVGGLGGGLGALGGPVAPGAPAPAAADLAKLKEQNEQLVKQVAALTKMVEELQKSAKKTPEK